VIRQILHGANALRRGFHLLRTVRSLRRLAFIPFLLNVVFFGVGIPFSIWLLSDWFSGLFPDIGWFSGALLLILEVLVALVIIVGSLFLFSTVGGIIGAPFNGWLAEAIEQHVNGAGGAIYQTANRDRTAGCIGGILTAFGRLGIFLLFYPPILALQLIPGFGTLLSTVCAFLYGVFVLSFDFTDPAFETRRLPFRERVRFILRRKALYLGFGGGAVVMMLVPVVNLLLMPVCVAGGTLLFLEQAVETSNEQ
jgi:CysZ protein